MSDLTNCSTRLIMSAPRYYDRDDYKAASKALGDLLERSGGRKFDRDQKRLARKYEAQIDAAREANDREVEELIQAEKARLSRQTEQTIAAFIEKEEAS